MRVSGSGVAGLAALLVGLGTSPSAAQERSRSAAPIIRVYSENGPISSNYVTPTIQVAEDSYVFAVAMDLDGQIQVLNPATPGISVQIRQHEQFRLPNFFGGFAQQYAGLNSYSGYDYAGYGGYPGYSSNASYSYSENDTRGTVIALASRAPFNLDRIERDGDWNLSTIRDLMDRRSPLSAAQALAAYIGAKGEPIGRDVMRFASAMHNFYASNYQYGCGVLGGLYTSPYAVSPLSVFIRVSQLQQRGQNVSILGFDACGMPIVGYGARETLANGFPRPPRTHDDSVRMKKGFPHVPGLGPQQGQPNTNAAYGFFPVTRRAEPQRRDTVGAQTRARPEVGQRAVPMEILIDRRRESEPAVSKPTVTGTEPPREHSKPVFRESPASAPPQRETPPPPRMEPTQSPPPQAEPPRYSPPPRVESPPPSAPPPRMEPRFSPPPSSPPPSSPPPAAAPAPSTPRIISIPVEKSTPPPRN
jgi:hypothetical protein